MVHLGAQEIVIHIATTHIQQDKEALIVEHLQVEEPVLENKRRKKYVD